MAEHSRPIKIIRVIARLNIGGPAVHTILVTKAFHGSRYTNILVAGVEGKEEGSMDFLAEQHSVKPLILKGLGREISILDDLKTLWRLYRLFRKERPDIVETHTAKAGAVGRLAAWLAGVPIRIHFFHGHVLYGYFGRFLTWVFKMIERANALITHRIVACSEKVRQDLIHFRVASPNKIVTIPYGFELDQFVQAADHPGSVRAEFGVASSVKVVGIVARLVPIKGHEIFLEAARRLVEKMPGTDMEFWIVGDGELRESIKSKVAELGLTEKVRFLAWRKDMEAVYADLDALALTSFNEGLPLVIIEAMAAGRPVVATNVGGVAEMVLSGETGFVVSVGDSEAVADALAQILSDPNRSREMGTLAMKISCERYGMQRLVKDLESLYESLLPRRGCH